MNALTGVEPDGVDRALELLGQVGILTADAVYTVTGDYAANNNAKLLDFVAKNVVAVGEVTEKDGVKSINIKSIKLAN